MLVMKDNREAPLKNFQWGDCPHSDDETAAGLQMPWLVCCTKFSWRSGPKHMPMYSIAGLVRCVTGNALLIALPVEAFLEEFWRFS